MSHIQIPLPENFQSEFAEMLTVAARKAITTAKEQDASYGREWLKQKEVCEFLNVSYGTLQKFRSLGLNCSTVDGITLISKREINRFLEEHY